MLFYAEHLLLLDSIVFKKDLSAIQTLNDSLMFGIWNKNSLEDTKSHELGVWPQSFVNKFTFAVNPNYDEELVLNVKSGIFEGEHRFLLKDVAYVEFGSVNATADSDGDGLPDAVEYFILGTDYMSEDTDGDGYSDGDEISAYSSQNPYVMNPLIADLPVLTVDMIRTPVITINRSVSNGSSESTTISEGESCSNSYSISQTQSNTASLMHGWSVGANVGWGGSDAKVVVMANVGYNGSYTKTTGYSRSVSEDQTISSNYSNAVTTAKENQQTITGGTICVEAKVSNPGHIAYTVNDIKLELFAYYANSGMKTVAELSREGGSEASFALNPGETQTGLSFCNKDVSLARLGDLINNPGSIFLGTSTFSTSTSGSGDYVVNDFTKQYTAAIAKTALVSIDYGPYSTKQPVELRVATKTHYNKNAIGINDIYLLPNLAEILKTAQVPFEEDFIEVNGKMVWGLKSIDGVSFAADNSDTSSWFISVIKAANPNVQMLFSPMIGSTSLSDITIGAGDKVQFMYNEDWDHDGVPASMERLLGISDDNADSDDDGLTDYQEIYGWVRLNADGDTLAGPFYTYPDNKDTDGDGYIDPKDENPNVPSLASSVKIKQISIYDSVSARPLTISNTTYSNVNCFVTDTLYNGEADIVIETEETVKRITLMTLDSTVLTTSPNDVSEATFSVGNLSVAHDNIYLLKVVAQDGSDSLINVLSITSRLAAPTNLALASKTTRDAILLSYTPVADKRIMGYAILRIESARPLNDECSLKIPIISGVLGVLSKSPSTVLALYRLDSTKTVLQDGAAIDGTGITVVALNAANANTYEDKVGMGSPYCSYRVYAYTKEGNTYYYSDGSNVETRSVGRINVTFKNTGHGTEYLFSKGFRMDMGITARFYEGKDVNGHLLFGPQYHYWFYDAGSANHGNTVWYNSHADKSGDDNSVPINNKEYTCDIGQKGLYLYLEAHADGGYVDYGYSIQGVYWPFENMVRVINQDPHFDGPNGKSGNAPVNNSENKFNFGRGGVEANPSKDGCDDECGKEPHAGFKFIFRYNWMD